MCVYCATRYIIIWLESNIKYSIVEPGFSGNVDGNYEKGSLPLYNMVSGCARRKWLQSRQETPSASSPTPPTRVLGGRQAHAFRPRGSNPKGLYICSTAQCSKIGKKCKKALFAFSKMAKNHFLH